MFCCIRVCTCWLWLVAFVCCFLIDSLFVYSVCLFLCVLFVDVVCFFASFVGLCGSMICSAYMHGMHRSMNVYLHLLMYVYACKL